MEHNEMTIGDATYEVDRCFVGSEMLSDVMMEHFLLIYAQERDFDKRYVDAV